MTTSWYLGENYDSQTSINSKNGSSIVNDTIKWIDIVYEHFKSVCVHIRHHKYDDNDMIFLNVYNHNQNIV